MQSPKNSEGINSNIRQQLTAGFSLARLLLEAQDEESAILAMMGVSAKWLGAQGAAFLPLNEWTQSIPALRYGESTFMDDDAWHERLSDVATRHACRVCESKQAGPECVLYHQASDVNQVFCIGLQCGGRKVGVISFFFLSQIEISDDQHSFLAEAARLVDLTLVALRAHFQELDAIRNAIPLADLKTSLIGLDGNNETLLDQLEYKAVLDERTRLAREIHDGLAQTLAFLKLEITRIQSYVSKGELDVVDRMLQSCHKTLSDAYLDARQAIDNLRQAPTEVIGDWLKIAAEDFAALANISVDVSNIHLHHVFSAGVNIQLIRIVQEALNNIRKHSNACSVIISAFESGNEAVIEIHDNGLGFNPEISQAISQYGLRSMRERAESIGSKIQIISSPDLGTTIRLVLPILELDRS